MAPSEIHWTRGDANASQKTKRITESDLGQRILEGEVCLLRANRSQEDAEENQKSATAPSHVEAWSQTAGLFALRLATENGSDTPARNVKDG